MDRSRWYDTMLVCEQGHMITSTLESHPDELVKRCSKCGAQTISKCPKCSTDIRCYDHIPGVIHMGPNKPPSYCHECGAPYPWASNKEMVEAQETQGFSNNKNIFIAHSFGEDKIIKGLKTYLEKEGFKWVEGKREDLGSISEDILKKIRESSFFIAVMTKKDELKTGAYTTSSWLVEEKGAALALGRRPLIMVENGVDRHYVGSLQSDDQLVYFDRDEFAQKMLEAVSMINVTLDRNKVEKVKK